MLDVSGTTRVLVATTPVSLRGSFNRLHSLVVDAVSSVGYELTVETIYLFAGWDNDWADIDGRSGFRPIRIYALYLQDYRRSGWRCRQRRWNGEFSEVCRTLGCSSG